MKVNEKIRFFRKLNGWSQEEVAIKLNMSPNGYGNIERGDTDMPLSRLSQIAQLFGVEEADFFTATEKNIFNLIAIHNVDTQNSQNHHDAATHSPDYLQLKTDFEKQTFIIQQLEKENSYLKDLIAVLMKKEKDE
jgi:transcriptional regulator with XRE-family HTH domain